MIKDPVKARQYAILNCIYYNECRDALAHTNIKAEMNCHECAGVMQKDCFRKELGMDYFGNTETYIEFPLRMPY